jgi:sirohydrochlorin cobaltochelatase
MDGVILFAHGSLLCGSGQALEVHAERLRARGVAPVVEIGYLNYSEPRFLGAVRECVARGVTRIVVAPYFLVPGKFVRVDLPQAVAEAQALFPERVFRVAEAVGYDERLADALIASANAARTAEAWRDELKRASDFCRASPQCPLYATASCPQTASLALSGVS